MKKYVTLFFLLITGCLCATPPDSTNNRIPSSIKVADWYDFNKAAYSLTFDDGLQSQYTYVFPVLEKYGLKATFFIVTGSLQDDPDQKPNWRFGYWHQFVEMSKKGHELGSHTVTHGRMTTMKDGKETEVGTLQYELAEPVKSIQEHIPGYQVISFAYPFIAYNAHVKEETLKRYPVARSGGMGANIPNQINWGAIPAMGLEYSGTRTTESDVRKVTDLESYIQAVIVDEAAWGVYLAHDVMPLEEARAANDSWHPVSLESFEVFAKWLKAKQDSKELWVAPMGSVARYEKERENLVITEKEKTTTKIAYLLEDQLPDAFYNQPLSLEITVPDGWKKVKVVQGKKKETVLVNEGKISVKAVPSTDLLEILLVE